MDRTKDVPEVTITQADDQCVAEILSYFDSYHLATVTPVCHEIARHRTEATRPLTAEIADLRAQLDDEKRRHDQLFDWFNDRDPDAMAEYLHAETAKEFAARRPA